MQREIISYYFLTGNLSTPLETDSFIKQTKNKSHNNNGTEEEDGTLLFPFPLKLNAFPNVLCSDFSNQYLALPLSAPAQGALIFTHGLTRILTMSSRIHTKFTK